MISGRRLLTLLVVLALVGTPAVALRAFCAGRSCNETAVRAPAPFCSLAPAIRELVGAGFRDGRSPDALGISGAAPIVADVGHGVRVPWPSTTFMPSHARVPVVLRGPDIVPGEIAGIVGLDQIAPTLEPVLGIRRPHPEVRAGPPIEGVVRSGAPPAPLVVEVVWKGIGMRDLTSSEGSPTSLATLLGGADVVSGVATPGSLPLDPAAVLTTIGSGGLPSQHGVTGTLVRNDAGRVVRAFGRGAPVPVIAAVGDDLDRLTHDDAKIGLVATDVSDRGLIGGTWYGGRDDDTVLRDARPPAAEVAHLLDAGFGADRVPDLLGVVLGGSLPRVVARTRAVITEVAGRVPRATFVVTATGSLRGGRTPVRASSLASATKDAIPAVGATGSAGLFLDERAASAGGISTQEVVDAMKELTTPDGAPAYADAFPSFAVRFGRYC